MNFRSAALSTVAATLLTLVGWPVLPAAHAATLCTVVADATTGKVLEQRGTCDQRITPASTFKLAISLMGYDSGYLIDEHLPALPFRKGYPDWMASWKSTTDPTTWIKNSVVWYSQQITRSLGYKRLRKYVTQFGYGNEDVSGDPGKHNGLTRAWLSSSLKISPLEQVAFLENVVNRRLPVSSKAYAMTARITSLGVLPNGWEVHGKTGTASAVLDSGVRDEDHTYGWFVGWASRGDRICVFTHLLQVDNTQAVGAGVRARDEFLEQLPALLDSL